MDPFSLLIKPASADCNLCCDYCFYLEKKELYTSSLSHRMNQKQLELLIKKFMKTDQPVYSFLWQGGEPSVMGIEFYEKAVQLQKKYCPSGKKVFNAIQTNGFALSDKFIKHLQRNNYLVGLSMDGPQAIHDSHRVTRNRNGSHKKVLSAWKKLNSAGVETNTVTLVSASNVKYADKIYQYFKEIGSSFHQYIPCVEFDKNGNLLPFAITAREWGDFLCELFNVWYEEDITRISIRYFDALLEKMVTGNNAICQLGNCCDSYLVAENNCDIYPCDFFVRNDLLLGNLKKISFPAIRKSKKYISFSATKADISPRCRGCQYFKYCAGDCMKHRLQSTDNLSHLCEGYKQFFEHSLNKLKIIAKSFME